MKKWFWLPWILLAVPSFADIGFDAVAAGNANAGSTNTVTWNHTSTGSNRMGLVALTGAVSTGADDITSVTWGGTAMTLAGKVVSASYAFNMLYLYYITGQATGSQAIVVTAGSNHY